MIGRATGPATALASLLRGAAGAARLRAAAVLLGAGSLVWAALPAVHRAYAGLALALAIAGVAAGGLRLALAAVPVPEDSYWPSPGLRVWRAFLEVVRQVPWEEGAVIGIVWLEVLHPSRPWHTAILGAGLIACLLIAHLAESDAPWPRSGRRPGCRASARPCSRWGRAPGCCPRRARGRVRRCCGWWRRARSSWRPAWSSPTCLGGYPAGAVGIQ